MPRVGAMRSETLERLTIDLDTGAAADPRVVRSTIAARTP